MKLKKEVLSMTPPKRSLFMNLRKLILNVFCIIKNGFLRFAKFILQNFSIILYLSLSILFLVLLIILVIQDRMGEVDIALKYVLLPLYIFSALFSGRIASKKLSIKLWLFYIGNQNLVGLLKQK